ncbi:MAG: TonB-dependent receptor [Gammaproteobacteria bacterium]
MPTLSDQSDGQTPVIEKSDTYQKVLELNLNPRVYGTIAEIGAGQEVAASFFRAGGAAGTVAKTISAYDMKVSDEIYGKAGRYVSRERVVAMVETEFELLEERLGAEREDTCFFAFANSVSARNYAGTNECHGWLGLRFQAEPHGPPNDVVLHVNLCDQTNLRQQRALGILGVNLIHASMSVHSDPAKFLDKLFEDLSLERMEVDLIHVSGPDLPVVTDCEIGLALVRQQLAWAVCFNEQGKLVPPTEIIRKRPIALERGLFKDPDIIDPGILKAGMDQMADQLPADARPTLGLMELSVNNLREGDEVEDAEYLRRIRHLFQFGHCLLLTRLRESYSVTEYLRRYSQEPMGYNHGISTLALMFAEGYYTALPGGMLEATGKLLADNVRIYAHAMPAEAFNRHLDSAKDAALHVRRPDSGEVTTENLDIEPPVSLLYQYLLDAGWIQGVD